MIAKTTHHFVPVLISCALLLGGCKEEPESLKCTSVVEPSVVATVLDSDNTPIPDATVTYSVGGAAAQSCYSYSSTDGEYRCGSEEPGQVTVTAIKDSSSASMTVTVPSDPCHVETQQITLILGG